MHPKVHYDHDRTKLVCATKVGYLVIMENGNRNHQAGVKRARLSQELKERKASWLRQKSTGMKVLKPDYTMTGYQ